MKTHCLNSMQLLRLISNLDSVLEHDDYRKWISQPSLALENEFTKYIILKSRQSHLLYLIKNLGVHKSSFICTLPRILNSENNEYKSSNFSSGSRRWFIKGELKGTPVEALPDTGAEMCFISNTLASSLDLRIVLRTRNKILLANKKSVLSPGMVVVPWKFEGEREKHTLSCWILPECVHDLVLGCHFLRGTQTLTKFLRRIRSELVSLPRRLRLRFLGEENQRLWGYLDDNFTAALPDTGSDVMVISRAYARKLGLAIDHDTEKLLEVEFADGTTTWTSGVVRNIPWSVGGKTVRCDFHVLDDLCVDVILSNDYLFNMNIFAECEDYFFESDSEEDLSRFCNIRLLGRYGESLNLLEEEYLNDGECSITHRGPEDA